MNQCMFLLTFAVKYYSLNKYILKIPLLISHNGGYIDFSKEKFEIYAVSICQK